MRSTWSWEADVTISDLDQTIPSRVTNEWTEEQRCAVLLLKRFFENDWKDVSRIFSAHFKFDLKKRGFGPAGLTGATICTQWYDLMRKKPDAYRLAYVNTEFINSTCTDTTELIRELRHSAWKLGIALKPRAHEDLDTLRKFGHPGHVRTSLRLYQNLHSNSSTENLSSAACINPPSSATGIVNQTNRSILVLPEVIAPDAIPPIIFRCYDKYSQGTNSTTGFEAPFHINRDLEAPDIDSYEMLDYGNRHFNYWEKRKSALISTTSSLIWALHKARICLLRGGQPRVSIIDARAVSNRTRIYPATPLCARAKREMEAKFRYNANYEYLVWQRIEEDAILADFLYDDLKYVCKQFDEVNQLLQLHIIAKHKTLYQARHSLPCACPTNSMGIAIGILAKFLRPDVFLGASWLEDLIPIIFQNWKITTNEPWHQNRDFVNGLRSGIGKRLPQSQSFIGVFVPSEGNILRDADQDRITRQYSAPLVDSVELLLESAESFLRD